MVFIRLIVLVALFLSIGCSVETQKGRENFEGGTIPTALASIANQTYELTKYEKDIVTRVAQDQSLTTLPVAVIDNGADLAHPDLVQKYAFDVQNGHVVGAGHDFMGDDRFASASLVNPELYAFNAVEVKKGLIVAGDSSVFEVLLSLDKDFSAFFLKKLSEDVVLKNSVFRRVGAESFNVFGLYKMVFDAKYKKNYFDPELHTKWAARGKLINDKFRDNVKTTPELADYGLRTIYEILDQKTWPSSTGGVATPLAMLTYLEHGDLMIKKIEEAITEFPRTAELKAGLDKLLTYRVDRNHSVAIDMTQETVNALDLLSRSLEYHKRGITEVDPILALRETTVSNQIIDLDLFREKTEYPLMQLSATSVLTSMEDSNDKLALAENALRSIEKTAAENYETKKYLATLPAQKKFTDAFVRLRAPELIRLFDPDFHSEYTSMYRKYFHRNKHPYLSSYSEGEVHGTHTAGIVAAQNANIRIYPIRITTRSALITKTEKVQVLSKFKAAFHAWLAEPIVIEAFYSKLSKVIPEGLAKPQTPDEMKKFADAMLASMDEPIEVEFEKNTLDFIFFSEFEEAINHVADKKLKIASISLGTEFSNRIPKLADLDPDKDKVAIFQFLNFEFTKYHLGSVIGTKGKNTLFVVAAGNSGTWVDGKTHSAVPIDLTSRFLKTFEDGKTRIAPNNHLTNVLGVGSLSQDEDLSDFTNTLIGTNTPLIFAVGEDVLSPVKMTDLSPVLTIINARVKEEYPTISLTDARIVAAMKKNPRFAGIASKDDFDSKIGEYLTSGMTHATTVSKVFKLHLAMKYSDYRQKLSGTSMATPAVAGYISDMLLKRMTAAGLRAEDIYDNPDYTPQKIMADLNAVGSPVFPESPEYPLKKIDVRGKYVRGDKIQELDKYLNSILGTPTVK
ncbi:S8 family serine peptidase [Bdellovibrio sp. HCB337]|uniref:S8 family serine peptidase n=1 Tax=Bdellovibrio sp. HCB337 TaxID=3394358 RepID=UPI0039A51932